MSQTQRNQTSDSRPAQVAETKSDILCKLISQASKEVMTGTDADTGEHVRIFLDDISTELSAVLLAISKLPNTADFAAERRYQKSISEAKMYLETIAAEIET